MEMNKVNVSINGNGPIELEQADWSTLDLIKVEDKKYHLILNNVNYDIELLQIDKNAKTMQLSINGEAYDCKISDQIDVLINKMGLEGEKSKAVKSIHAPMPGKVLEVLVKKGQEFEEGESLIILEAMKMENVIKSPGKGKVNAINISKGDAVEKGELLISL